MTIFDGSTAVGSATVSGGSYSITTSALSAGVHSITAKQTETDTAGNVSAFSTASSALSVTIDTTAPTVTVTSNPASVSNGHSSTITFQFSEAVTGFTASDTTATRGNLTNFITADADTYTETYNRTSNGSNAHVDVTASSYTDIAGNAGAGGGTPNLPAGVSGSPINLALSDPTADASDVITLTFAGALLGWSLSEGADNGDGTWTVQTNDVRSLTVTSPADFVGALVLNVTETWTNPDGSVSTAVVADNVEAYASGSPIFAWSGDDYLTGSSGHDLFVFSQPIGHDTVYSFDAAADQIDLIGFAGFASFSEVQAYLADDSAGDAVITLGDGQSITVHGMHAELAHGQ